MSLKILKSYAGGDWTGGSGAGADLVNPASGETVAWCSSNGIDLARALSYARQTGGPALRKLSYGARADLLGQIADLLATDRDRWIDIARQNSGNTKSDASIDVDGAIGTVKYFARLGAKLGDATILTDGAAIRVARDPNFQAIHVGIPVQGVAVHINAYNFPAWGLWEKAAVSLLAGVPVFTKPATATAWLAQEMVEKVVESGLLPSGALSVLCGSARDLLDHVCAGDVIAFTGSAETGETIRRNSRVCRLGVRVNIEADSLNAIVLGPDAAPDSPAFGFFVREVVKEVTAKAGQKCTAIRRILVPSNLAKDVTEAFSAEFAKVVVGNPANPAVTMGPLVNMSQRKTVEGGIASLSQETEVVYRQNPLTLLDATLETGAFVGPTLMRVKDADQAKLVHELEIFGPAATIVPYTNEGHAFALAQRGGGSLVASIFSADPEFLSNAAVALGTSHGRLLLVDPSIGDSHTGHGIVMPSCIHGGPGRAGGGEELGAFRGLWFYHQRVALQGSPLSLQTVSAKSVNPANLQ